MLTKTKLALAVALLAGTASVASAQYDPNMANRYPAYNEPIAVAPQVSRHVSAPRGTLQSAQVGLRNNGAGQTFIDGSSVAAPIDQSAVDGADRASSPYSGF